MKKILSFKEVTSKSRELRKQGKSIVLVGGVFDILHFGHIRFLEEAKRQGDMLLVALEPDLKVTRLKGPGRPIHDQNIRAHMVAALECVDYVFILPVLTTNQEYESMVKMIRPTVIGVTEQDPLHEEKRKQAETIGGKLVVVTAKIPTPSTTQLLKLLSLE